MTWKRGGSAVLVSAMVALSGCGVPGEAVLEFNDTEPVKITEVRITPGSGDVTVRTSAMADTRIRRTVRYRHTEPDGTTYRLDGTVLHVATKCGPRCGVSYEIEAPPGVAVNGELGSGDLRLNGVAAVQVEAGSGDVTVNGATGAVDARTGSGDVTATDVTGALTLGTGSGDVEGHGLAGGVTVETRSGDVTLELTRAASVQARTNSGNATVTVPAGRYRVSVDTGSGDQTVDVPSDPAATNVLDVSTGSGDVTLSVR